ncbi:MULTISPECIES: TipAS antibiotic-recognition domain-containing protein [Aerococcus]|uniref:TipAS antibiotic-recognition domain-containing protein n=1 Tax=Aerococcus urinae (strain CCUG 59500 / ACS-120-V-Col10a) TaxID=2976812 RepID=UPI000200E5CB|nr:TipAS antibiotic-recognition domain-containing protein [Aerococcus sp. Group 1]AEA00995.1 TipAS antibiotic-recognition domain protein [Aerococcus sp. Group 1]MCY3030381.1 TipAS antibiotic-recognition domain-containing protein [Aerococcus sp. Group 1]MCY3054867.1 TipAS antibiotic-recognition domain-containing protein [Aerococcus sp. Group 1]MCY3056597.1 TipAS antibiotic-recognition domain-containing protein [Aerococcus sp. Group 1]MCY3061821.1 TipAS antibiotic-recognition domain-containing p
MKKSDRKQKKALAIKRKRDKQEVKHKWGSEKLHETEMNWQSYDPKEKQDMVAESKAVFKALAQLKNEETDSQKLQEAMQRWHRFIGLSYEPSLEILRGLSYVYRDDERFRKNLSQFDPDLPDFLFGAINNYVDSLEEIWLQEQVNTLEEKH